MFKCAINVIVVATLTVFGGGHAISGGTLSLQELLERTKSSSELADAVNSELKGANLDAPQISCDANRLGRQWKSLGGERIGPYICQIGGKTLEVTATPTFYDLKGNRLKMSEPRTPNNAFKFDERDFSWTIK